MLSATIEWSVISMLKNFLFVLMAISFLVTFLFERSGCLHRNYDEDVEKEKENGEGQRIGAEEREQSQLRETCSACGPALCSLGFCFFALFTSTCCKFARGENPNSFTFYLANGFNFFWRGFQLRFLRAFGDFSRGLVELLSVPVRNEEESFFSAKSALVALWVPCVVGRRPRTFLITALVSRMIRIIALVVTLIIYKFSFPAILQSRTILLFCATEDTLNFLNMTPSCLLPECFKFCDTNETDCLVHRFRKCEDEDDSPFFYILVSVLILSSFLSLLATLRLKQLSSYERLFQISRTPACCSPFKLFKPILHRTVIFRPLERGNYEEFYDKMVDAPKEALLRPNKQGQSLLHLAAMMSDTKFLEIILRKMKGDKLPRCPTEKVRGQGSRVNIIGKIVGNNELCLKFRDSNGRSPIFYACQSNNSEALVLLLEAGFKSDEVDREGLRPLQVAMEADAKECVFPLLSSSESFRNMTQVGNVHRNMGEVTIIHKGRETTFTKNWRVIDMIRSSRSAAAPTGVIVTRENQKPIDPVLDRLVDILKREANDQGLSAISKAVEDGNAEQVDLLIQAGLTVELNDASGVSPLERAAKAKQYHLCVKLLQAGASVDFRSEEIISEAVRDNRESSTHLAISLLKAGANPKTRVKNGMR